MDQFKRTNIPIVFGKGIYIRFEKPENNKAFDGYIDCYFHFVDETGELVDLNRYHELYYDGYHYFANGVSKDSEYKAKIFDSYGNVISAKEIRYIDGVKTQIKRLALSSGYTFYSKGSVWNVNYAWAENFSENEICPTTIVEYKNKYHLIDSEGYIILDELEIFDEQTRIQRYKDYTFVLTAAEDKRQYSSLVIVQNNDGFWGIFNKKTKKEIVRPIYANYKIGEKTIYLLNKAGDVMHFVEYR